LISDILKETQLNPQYLELELTENIIIGNGKIIDNIRALKAVGVQIALDDFGTGYSNLHHLKLLPIDRIKIDKGYTQNINENSNDEAIIRAVIAMGNSLNLQVLAEGIETPEQLAFLQAANCDEGQGFYFSKPLSADDLEKFLTTYQEAFQTKVSVKKK
jgi:EAL domain-containing protein (putative c-di-GMP-specific phosphodiesterase class I)